MSIDSDDYEDEGYEETTLSDEEISDLISETKFVTTKDLDSIKKPSRTDGGYLRSKITIYGELGNRFEIHIRENPRIQGDFSIILAFRPVGHDKGLNLRRYNGNSHPHTNAIEGSKIKRGQFHIHQATKRYQEAGHKAEDYAEPTDKYKTLQEAIEVMIVECQLRIRKMYSIEDFSRELNDFSKRHH